MQTRILEKLTLKRPSDFLGISTENRHQYLRQAKFSCALPLAWYQMSSLPQWGDGLSYSGAHPEVSAASHIQRHAGDVAVLRVSEEEDGAGNFVRLGEAAHRELRCPFGPVRRRIRS